jgi:hypothetical protein
MSLCELAFVGFLDKLTDIRERRQRKSKRMLRECMISPGGTASGLMLVMSSSSTNVNNNDGSSTSLVHSSSANRITDEYLQRLRHPPVMMRGFETGHIGPKVDSVCARLFPFGFGLFNIGYWWYYLSR